MSDENNRVREVYEKRRADGVIGKYSLFNPGELYMLQRREQITLQLLQKHKKKDIAESRILEIGCGRGTRLFDWCRWGASPLQLTGIDLVEPFVREAKIALPTARLMVASADHLPFRDDEFDIIVQSTVFTSILNDGVRRDVAAEMCRVASPEAMIVWYDFRYPNPKNADVRAIPRQEIVELFPGWNVDGRSITLLPPLARIFAKRSWLFCLMLEMFVPALRSHYVAILQRKK